ncbi:MAG: molybdopterin molybdotransferase MoeA [bacterium]|nr:molybdopterin molybdotransferase MoeA [bacterium]
MLTFEEAQSALTGLPLPSRTECVALTQAAGRVVASDIHLDRDQPGFDRATMDGYALRLAAGDRYRVVGTVFAGTTFDGALEAGDAVRIMTGAPCPADATVVPIEQTDGGTESVQILEERALAPGRNIAWRGEDGHAGDVVVPAGTRLGPVTVSAAAMAGAEEIEVFVPPRLGIVTTGDEVGSQGAAGVRDSNGPLLLTFAAALGVPATRTHARDEADELEARLRAAADGADVVVTVGGVSMGAKDLIPQTAGALGFETVFHRVAVQPGKPVFVARRGEQLFVGLPGNPVSVLATAHLFLVPAVGRYLGGWSQPWLSLPLAEPFEHRRDRRLFLPARTDAGGVAPVHWHGSGDLLAAASCDGLIDVRPKSVLGVGDPVPFLPFLGHVPGARGVIPPRA